jgi:DNA-binding NarL/FixJ family response regulator
LAGRRARCRPDHTNLFPSSRHPSRRRDRCSHDARRRRLDPRSAQRRRARLLDLIAAGLSDAQIAEAPFISDATVKSHVSHIFAKAGVNDRARAVHDAYSHGLNN